MAIKIGKKNNRTERFKIDILGDRAKVIDTFTFEAEFERIDENVFLAKVRDKNFVSGDFVRDVLINIIANGEDGQPLEYNDELVDYLLSFGEVVSEMFDAATAVQHGVSVAEYKKRKLKN